MIQGNIVLLCQLIYRQDLDKQTLMAGHNLWYQTTKEDMHFITNLSRRGGIFYPFLGCVA
jgi:hypothetical protein